MAGSDRMTIIRFTYRSTLTPTTRLQNPLVHTLLIVHIHLVASLANRIRCKLGVSFPQMGLPQSGQFFTTWDEATPSAVDLRQFSQKEWPHPILSECSVLGYFHDKGHNLHSWLDHCTAARVARNTLHSHFKTLCCRLH